MGETASQKKHKFLPIIRTDAGGFFGFGEFDGPSFDHLRGRFTGLLPPKVPDIEQRTLAKAVLARLGVTDAVPWRGGEQGSAAGRAIPGTRGPQATM